MWNRNAVVDRFELNRGEEAAVEGREVFNRCSERVGGFHLCVGSQNSQGVIKIDLERAIGCPVQLSGEGATGVSITAKRIARALMPPTTPLQCWACRQHQLSGFRLHDGETGTN